MARSRKRISLAQLNSSARRRQKALGSSVCQNFFGRSIFVRQKITKTLSWLRKCREHRRWHWEIWRAKPARRLLRHSSRNAALALKLDRKSTRLNSSHDQISYAV